MKILCIKILHFIKKESTVLPFVRQVLPIKLINCRANKVAVKVQAQVNICCTLKIHSELHRRTSSLKEKSQKQGSGEISFIHGSAQDSVFSFKIICLNRQVLVNSSNSRNTGTGDMTRRQKHVNMKSGILILITQINSLQVQGPNYNPIMLRP